MGSESWQPKILWGHTASLETMLNVDIGRNAEHIPVILLQSFETFRLG